ncbi:class II aldolase/adducin family protein [Lacrimispora sp. 210928-DFI.3.58]|uniref:class II aldolase/adducin family protein n=1 Tax=Lacrimispora sp. 210928-DFI.3.58 TaxID=2883214 RepID=UPI002222BEF1
MEELQKKWKDILWAAHSLFDRGKTSGSSANISFRHEDMIYISGSGTCFGTLKKEEFAMLSIDGQCQNSIKPSKELPLHMCLYKKSDAIQAVIHTHSFYATLWSCYKHENAENVIPSVTPYLNMKVGKIALIPYAPPGSSELFSLMEDRAHLANGFLLKNHGPLVGGKTIMDAFFGIEELEESARIACALRGELRDAYDTI